MGVLGSTSDTDSVGDSYESKLCWLLLHRHYQIYPNLKLCREDDNGVSGIIFEYKENEMTVYRHLQVKHLKDYRDGDFDLIKYFKSFRSAKNYYKKSGIFKDYIICTNLSIDLQKKIKIDFERITGECSILDIENNGKRSKRFRVKNLTGSVAQIKESWKKWQAVSDDLSLQPIPSTEDIIDYLKNLIFVFDLPDENYLDIILEDEIFKEMTNKAIYDIIFRRMVDRIEAKDSRDFLDYDDAKDLFDNNYLTNFTSSNYVWYNLQAPVSLFTGREEYLGGIHKSLQEKKRVVFCGIGGVGKTELARKYIELYSEEYNENILWINAENDESFIKCFRSLASKKLKIEKISDNSEAENVRLIIEKVFNWFQNSKCLLILDDATYSQYRNYIEPALSKIAYQPYIIITSRSKWENENTVELIKLNVFTESEATDFISESLSEFLNNNQRDSVRELGKTLQYLPLALQQACAYINSEFEYDPETYQISEYIENLQANCQEYLNYSLRDYCESGYAKTVWTTWDTTIQALQQEENYALKILYCMSFLLSDGIHANLLSKLFKEEQKLQKSIELLKKYLLITDRDNIYCLNSLVQLVIREKLQPDEKQEVLERISEAIVEKDETITRSIDHLAFAWMHLKEIFNSAPQLAEKYCLYNVPAEIALILFDINRYKEAYALGSETLKLMKRLLLENEQEQQYVQNIAPIIVKFICNIGEQREDLNKAKTILEIFKNMNKPLANTSTIFSIETDIISLCLKMADVHSAIKIFSESFLISMAGAKEHHIAILLRTEILGDIFIELSEYDIASKVYCLIFARRKSNSRTNDPNILRISKKIANALSEAHINKQSRHPMYNTLCMGETTNLAKEVSSILWETYENQKKTDPNNHSDLSEIQEYIINAFISQREYKKALRRFKDISDERLLKNNCNMLAKKAFVLALLGRTNDALATRDDLKKHILLLERGDFKEIYPSIVQSRVRLALVTSLLGKVDEALTVLEEVWNRFKYSIGFYNIHIMNILNIINYLYLRKNKHDGFLRKEYIQCVKFTKLTNLNRFGICTSAMLLQLQQETQSEAISHLLQNHDFDDWVMEEAPFLKLDDEKDHHRVSGISVETKLNEKAFLNNDCRHKYAGFIQSVSPECKALSKAISLSKLKDPFATVKSGNLAQLKKLIKEGVDVNTEDENKWTLLHYAAKADKPDIVVCLLQNGADATRVTKEFKNTLHVAVERNNLMVAEVLLNCNVETSKMLINAKTKKDGVTVLHIASKQGSLDMLRLLLTHGAIYDMKSKAGKSPLQMARDIIVGALFKEIDMRFRFFETFEDDRALEPLINYPDNDYFAVFGTRNIEGYSLLQLAVLKNCKNLVELILNFKATISTTIESLNRSLNIDSVLKFDRTISNLLRDDEIRNIEYLSRMKNFVQLVRTHGKSVLWKFILSTIEDMLDLLDCNELAKFVIEMQLKLLTELMYGAVLIDAAKRDDFKTFELCLEKTNFLDSFDMEGITPIHYAATNGNKKMVELLLDRNVKSHCSIGDDGWSGGRELPPNFTCTLMGVSGVNDRGSQGTNFCSVRFNMGASCEVTALLGDLIQSITPKKRTPLHLAVENHHIEVAKLLLERDSSYEFVNSSTETGSTALHLAVKNAHLEMIQLLLENYADYSITDDDELRPAELIEEKETEDLLVEEKKIKDLFILIDELHDDTDVERVLERLSKIEPAERRPLLNAISAQGKMLRHIIVAKCKDKKKISDIIGVLSEQDSLSQADLARKLLDVMLELVEKNKNNC